MGGFREINLQMNFKAVLFDLDGTLLDTLEDLADSVNAVLEKHGYPVHPPDAYKTFVGDGVGKLLRLAIPDVKIDEKTIEELDAEMREEYKRRWYVNTRPYDGICDMLSVLTDRGVKLSVLSNKKDDFTKLCVGRFLGDCPFEMIVGVSPAVPLKPDPTGAKQISRELDIPPEQFLYLGDTNTDMQTAVAAGMYPVGALWGFRTARELTENGAKTLLDHPSKLPGLL